MSRALLSVTLLLSACTIHGRGNWPVAAGGSVTDFDRSGAGVPTYLDTAPPAGGYETIGVDDTDGSQPGTRVAERIVPITPGPDRALIAGPPQLGRLIADPETIRTIERALADRGYYSGPVDGVARPALTDSIGRFQADRKLPATGAIDAATASALGVKLPPPPPLPGSG